MKHRYDRRAVMKDAHKRYRAGLRLNCGWTWAQCLSLAWCAAKMRRQHAINAAKPQRDILRIAA